jgi:tRNA1Val (adenine37-N6)-methyltransferase
MGDDVFNFQQFSVRQDRCAMKVCTDATLFAAWTAEQLKQHSVKHVLDIGAGTGLLSLVLAQALQETDITAIELDDGAALQASENFDTSPWSRRLQVIKADARSLPNMHLYDHIISNPPFFSSSLRSPDDAANLARHSTGLTFEELLQVMQNARDAKGSVSILLPSDRLKTWLATAGSSLGNLHRLTMVRQTERHSSFRAMLFYDNRDEHTLEDEIVIKQNGSYSVEMKRLLGDFYLAQAWK